MSKTKGFEVDFKLPDGQTITRHLHKLSEVKTFVEEYKIPSITIHGTADKWTGDFNKVAELNRWPIVPTQLDERDDDCPTCNPKKQETK